MNITTINSRPAALRMAAVAAIVAGIAGTAGTANASEPREYRVGSVSMHTHGSFGEPLAALGGQTLAQYVSDHWARVIVAGV